ncbi:MAG: RluA family pseudouridine synthase [Treponema sp.]|jgi:23S rRNA pseudouridine955/2504/2580 synthase|nr:RluA family pseudouridine synthase [Treponema sp.]
MDITLTAAADDDGRRLDRILRKALPEFPLSMIHRLLRKGRILVDGRPGEAADRVRAGSLIRLPRARGTGVPGRNSPDKKPEPAGTPDFAKSPGGLDILREEGGLLFLNKPPGIAVHGPGSLDTLVQAYLGEKIPPSLSFRPGPLHRLDKPTSGIIVFSVTLEGARYFSALLREGRVKKQYLALVEGEPDAPALWEDPLFRDGDQKKTLPGPRGEGARIADVKIARTKIARTRIFPLASSSGYSLIMAEIETGRTHQIRAQGALHGFPLAGDRKYGGSFLKGGFLLHAYTLEFQEASSPASLILSAPIPEKFRRRIAELFPEKIKNPEKPLSQTLFHDIL